MSVQTEHARPTLYERMGVDGVCPSPVCWRARIALALKGVECEHRAVRFADVDRLAEVTGSRTVPVLAWGGALIVNSDAIAAHLDVTLPDRPRLLGDGAAEAAVGIERDLGMRIALLAAVDFPRRLVPEDRAYYQSSREARFGKSFEELEAMRAGLELDLAFSIGRLETKLDGRRHLAGDAVGWPDIVAYADLLWLEFASPRAMPELVNPVRGWFDRLDSEWRPICLAPSSEPTS